MRFRIKVLPQDPLVMPEYRIVVVDRSGNYRTAVLQHGGNPHWTDVQIVGEFANDLEPNSR